MDLSLDLLHIILVLFQPKDGLGQAGVHVVDILGADFHKTPGIPSAPAFHGSFLKGKDRVFHRFYSFLQLLPVKPPQADQHEQDALDCHSQNGNIRIDWLA